MQNQRVVEYIEAIRQDAARIRERIWANKWSELLERRGEHLRLAAEILHGIYEHLGHHTTEVPTVVQLAWNLDSSRDSRPRGYGPPIRIYRPRVTTVGGEKGLPRGLPDSRGCQSPQTP